VVAPAAALATLIIQRRSLLRALYNLAQMAITVAAAGWLAVHVGGCPASISHFRDPGSLMPFLNVGIVYFAVNTGLVSAVVALWEGQSFFRAWRENYGYADDLLTSLALFLLSPLMALSFLSVGPAGLAFVFVPMLLVRNAAARYIQLRDTQEHLLWNERMAAMGEMAAEIGHELSNMLQVIVARTQMLLTDEDGVRGDRATRAVRVIFERAADMRRLTKGLSDFSHQTVLKQRERVNELVRDAVDFVSPQNRYDRIRWVLELDPNEPEADLDAAQFRQVLMNLFRNSADAMADPEEVPEPWIGVTTRARGSWVEVTVRDDGPGISEEIMGRIFEPWFTTKPDGHGFGLAASYRIIQNHGGMIAATSTPEGGAEIQIRLPARSRAWRAAA
jgi:signal transduction histidine kinase